MTDNEGKLRNINVHGQCATKYLFALQRELLLCLANYNKVKYYTNLLRPATTSTTSTTYDTMMYSELVLLGFASQHNKVGCKFFAKSAILEGTGVDLELKTFTFFTQHCIDID